MNVRNKEKIYESCCIKEFEKYIHINDLRGEE